VRGIKSREAVKEAKRKKREDAPETATTGLEVAASRAKGRVRKVDKAIATATEEVTETDEVKRKRRRGGRETASEPVNEPLVFITFIAAHPLGSEVTGSVEVFSSHGAYVDADGARCYLPLSAMGDPPPRSAREVLTKGGSQAFVIQALDPLRRGIELALPGFARIASGPTDETIDAEIHTGSRRGEDQGDAEAPSAPARRSRKRAAPATAAEAVDTGVDTVERSSTVPEPDGAGSGAGPRTRRSPRRSAAPPPVESGPVGGQSAPVPAPVVGQSAPAPGPRRNPARTGGTGPAAGTSPSGDATSEPTPAKRGRSRKAPAATIPVGSSAAPGTAPGTSAQVPGVGDQPASRRKSAAQAVKDPAAEGPSANVPVARKAPAAKKAPAIRKAPAAKKAPAIRKAPAAETVPASARTPAVKTAPAAKKAVTTRVPAIGRVDEATTAPVAKRVPVKKTPAKKAPAVDAGRSVGSTGAAPATKVPAKRIPAKKAVSAAPADPSPPSRGRRTAPPAAD
jgi:hypothetical protein